MKKLESRARKFLFARYVHFARANELVSVEAYDKDHALLRLQAEYPHVEKMEWDFLEELAPEHFVGMLGRDLPLMEKSKIAQIIHKLIH